MRSVGLKRLAQLESRLGYVFEDKTLALQALTHSSYGDGRRAIDDNERLEFLGDRVLGLMTACWLYESGLEKEGSMARRLNALVRKETCARVARRIGLGEALLISASEDRHGGRDKTSILGDACESLIAALYLDGGMAAAQAFYETFWYDEIDSLSQNSNKDPKTELQERASAENGGVPEYNVLERTGPDHRPLFVIEVSVDGIGSAKGTGKSKKDAERYAALHLLADWPVGRAL